MSSLIAKPRINALRALLLLCAFALTATPFPTARLFAQTSLRAHHAPKTDYAKADKHALDVPPEQTADLQTLAAYLTLPFKTEQEKTRAIFRWITHNISYDYSYYRALCREAQCYWEIGKVDHFYDKRQREFAAEIDTLKKQQKTMKPAAWKAAQKDRALKELLSAKAKYTKEYKIARRFLVADMKEAKKNVQAFRKKGHHIQDAATLLKRRFGVCAGYSALFHDLAQKAGLQSVNIGGLVKMSGQHILRREGAFGHAWNAVRIKNKWWMLDCTWADNGSSVDEHWFLLAPEQAIHSHFARDTAKQFLAKAITEREFGNLPPEADYSRYDAHIIDAQRTNITTDSAAVFTVSVPQNVSISAYQGKVEGLYDMYSLTAHNISVSSALDTALNRKIVRVRAVFPKSGDYHVALHYNGSQMMSYLVHADSGGAKMIASADTTTVKPDIIKQPLPERVIRARSSVAFNEPTSENAANERPQSRLQSRSRGILTFIMTDGRLGGKFVEHFERALEKSDIQRAVALCDTLAALFPGKAGTYFLRGMTLASAGNHQAAVEDFSRADSLEGNNPMIWLQRGISRYRLSDFPAAVLDLSRAMERDYNWSVESLYWRGLTRVKMNLRQKAFRDLWEAHELGNQEALAAIEKYCPREYEIHKEKQE